MKAAVVVLSCMALCSIQVYAQTENGRQEKEEFNEFRKKIHSDFSLFRQQCMEEFIEFVRNPWKEFEERPPVPKPKEHPVPPIVIPEEDKDEPVDSHPIVIEDVVKPQPVQPQPQPIEPIEEVPVQEEKWVTFDFYGKQAEVRFDVAHKIVLLDLKENHIADALEKMTSQEFDNMIVDCLALRKEWRLSDWAYLQLLKALSDQVAGAGTNEAALLLSYLYLQSGYKMRLATDGTKLYMLYASKHQIYEVVSFQLEDELFYGVERLPNRLYICEAVFPKEQSLSLAIPYCQQFAREESKVRTVSSTKYPEMQVSVSVNKKLLDFYNTYPQSMLDNNFMTRWAMYAQTPLDETVKEALYPQLQRVLSGKSELEAVSRLLNLLQTGLEYEYDNKVWGCDRAFFSEETLFYPYCDCEDRAIFLSRLVRDLLGLDAILVYYPGHLAMAVAFTEEVGGDYIEYSGKRFTICDPTYIGAPVGKTMPNMDNRTATVILLR